MEGKILVYDRTKAYSRMIKLYFSDACEMVYVTNRKRLPAIDLSGFDGAFAIAADGDDLIEIIYINSEISNMYIGTDTAYIKDIVCTMPGVTLVDLQQTKLKIVNKLAMLLQH